MFGSIICVPKIKLKKFTNLDYSTRPTIKICYQRYVSFVSIGKLASLIHEKTIGY
jgi:hypothetical protein